MKAGVIILLVGAILLFAGHHHSGPRQKVEAVSCEQSVQSTVEIAEAEHGFELGQYKVNATCHEDGSAIARLTWANGKIVWWTCRDSFKCEPS